MAQPCAGVARSMNHGNLIGCAALLLLAGCLAPPKRHAWETSGEDTARLQRAYNWPQLSTNDYVRVPDAKRAEAVTLLADRAFVRLEAAEFSAFAPGLSIRPGREAQAYLVRGALYLHPTYTVVRFDDVTGSLFVQQVTYNGETAKPFRWVAEPNALVAVLPRAPEHVYVDAVVGGDSIFRWVKSDTMDRR